MRIEGIQFYDFNSVNEGLRLTNRSAPTPDEKEIVEDIPYMQGILDFSMLLGERVFNNRTLTYSFYTKYMSYRKRKSLEQRIKRLLSAQGEGRLYDTHDQGYYWLGKVVNSSVVDNPTFNRLEIEVTFNVYPFMIRNKNYFDDAWDGFNFDTDVAGYTQFEVEGTRTITLYNAGDTTVRTKYNRGGGRIMAYNPDVAQDSFQIYSVILRTRPHRLYLTAERAFNKDDTHSVLYWEAGLERIATHSPSHPTYLSDPRGEIVQIGRRDIVTGENYKGWLRIDELNVPLNVVPLKYYTPHTRDIGKLWATIAQEQGISDIHIGPSVRKILGLWNDPNSNSIGTTVRESQVGKSFIVDMGFPPTSDANLFRNEYLENNRYQNANQSQMVSVKLQGRPNTRYIAKTSAPRNPESNNHEVFIGLYPSEPNQNIGFSVNEDIVFITDHKGEIELSFYDSELSGVNADYLDFLDYTYWVEILVHPNQVMTVPPDMTLQTGNNSYGLYDGDNPESGLELKPGINEITITGKGKISFYWNDEVMG